MDDEWDFDDSALAAIDSAVAEHRASQASSQSDSPAILPRQSQLPANPHAARTAVPPPASWLTPPVAVPPPACPSDLSKAFFDFFGHETFREGQEDAVRAMLTGRDCCVYWPTGKGKSVTYQLPALVAKLVETRPDLDPAHLRVALTLRPPGARSGGNEAP